MKKLSLICFGLLFTTFGFSQDFEINSIGTKYSSVEIETALSSANLCSSVFQGKIREITLDDGSKITFKPNGTCGHVDDHVFAAVKWSISGTTLMMGQSYEPSYTRKEKQQFKATKQ